MADTKITALAAITTVDPANDVLPIVDVSDTSMAASGTTKKITTNQILGSGGTATLASATITGDLTVDTSTLYVSSSADKVAIGTTSLSNEKLTVAGNISANAWLGRSNIAAPAGDCSIFRSADNTLGFGIASTTAMTLNSTGLGVGGSPTAKLSVVATGKGFVFGSTSATGAYAAWQYNSADVGYVGNGTSIVAGAAATDFGLTSSAGGKLWLGSNNGASYAVLDSSGNVGIGVTPSAWVTFKALELGELGGAIAAGGNNTAVLYNAYFNSGFKYARSGNASSYYQQTLGAHAWYNAPSGTAGNAITFTQAMTLDASGNLLVGTTTNGGNGVSIRPSTASPNVVLVGSDTSGGTSWQLYSTGTSSNRFYVTWAGVVNAVNTTISGISDARLKENVQDIDVGLGAILALKPRKFDWKAGKGKDIKGDRGFIAQEFEQVFPQLVDEWADPAPEGEAPYKSVRQDLIPVLVKAIQELAAEVNALKNA